MGVRRQLKTCLSVGFSRFLIGAYIAHYLVGSLTGVV